LILIIVRRSVDLWEVSFHLRVLVSTLIYLMLGGDTPHNERRWLPLLGFWRRTFLIHISASIPAFLTGSS
jgi:hypothetical protein